MKGIFRFLAMVSLFAVPFAGCSKDEGESGNGYGNGDSNGGGNNNGGYEFKTYSNGYEYGIRVITFPIVRHRVSRLPEGTIDKSIDTSDPNAIYFVRNGYNELVTSQSDESNKYLWTNLTTGEMYLYKSASSPALGINNEGYEVVPNTYKDGYVLIGNVYDKYDFSRFKYATSKGAYYFN